MSRVEARRPAEEETKPVDPLAALVDQARGGDRSKLALVLRGVSPAVLAVVRAVLGPRHPDLADVAQDSLIAFEAALPSFRMESTDLPSPF